MNSISVINSARRSMRVPTKQVKQEVKNEDKSHEKKEVKYVTDSEEEDETDSDEENDRSGNESYEPEDEIDSEQEDNSSWRNQSTKYQKVESHKQQDLTEYEKMVQKNKEEQMAFLQSLKFDEVKQDFSEAIKNLQGKRKAMKRQYKARIIPGPRRKSLRLQNVNVDLSEEGVAARVELQIQKEYEEEVQQKLPKILPFSDALVEGYSMEGFFKHLKKPTKTEPNDYASHFHTMQLPESQVLKVVSDRITAMALHPTQEKIIVAAGNKYGSVGFWNVSSDEKSFVFKPHTQGITNIKFHPDNPPLVVSSSYDGTVRCGDIEKTTFYEAYESEEAGCTDFDFLSPSTFLIGQTDGDVSLVDFRVRGKSTGKKHECHDTAVKSTSIHPLDKSYFLTAGKNGSIKLWNLRKLQKQPITEVNHHKRCVQSAYFSPLTGRSVLSTSSDDSICIFDSSSLGKSILLKKSLRRNNHTGRWLTQFRSTWIPNTDDTFVVGSMQHPRQIQVYNENMQEIFKFTHENLSCITSVNVFHPSLPVLAGANSSGRVYVFSEV